jgi:ribose transport system permease protein
MSSQIHAGTRRQEEPARTVPPRSRVLRYLRSTQATVLVAVIVIVAIAAQSQNSVFLTQGNVIDVLRAAVTTFIVGAGVTVVFTGGGIDLSVGAVFTLGAIIAAETMTHGVPWPLGVLAGLAAGTALGILNVVLIVAARIPPIIATLSTLYAVTGLSLVVTGGNPVAPLPGGFNALGQNGIGSLPLLVVYAVVVGIAFHVALARTRFGYNVKALGGNERSALANGVPITRVKFCVYALCALTAALAGILYSARTGTADPQSGGTDITLAAVAAVLVGGTSLFGGIGTIAGTALGAILFAEIQNALTVAGVNPLYQQIVIGVILAAAVGTDSWRRGRAFRV